MKTPSREDYMNICGKKLPSITEDAFQKYFEEYGNINDLYIPKEKG
jgi:hypothetical protein